MYMIDSTNEIQKIIAFQPGDIVESDAYIIKVRYLERDGLFEGEILEWKPLIGLSHLYPVGCYVSLSSECFTKVLHYKKKV